MDTVRNYLVSVLAACMIAVIASVLVRKSPIQKVVRMVGGILILLVVISPLLRLDTESLGKRIEEFCGERNFDTSQIEANTREQLAAHIKRTTEAYIENRAAELGAAIQAKVTVGDGEYPTPVAVTIIGTLTPEQRGELAAYLTVSLGIAADKQEWKLYGEAD